MPPGPLVIEFFRLLNSEPKAALDMLSKWGPNFLLGIAGSLPRESSALYTDGAANGTDPSAAQGRAAGLAPR